MAKADQQGSGLQGSGAAGGTMWMDTGAGAAGVEPSGEVERSAVYRGEGKYRVPSWPGNDANAVMLRAFVNDVKLYRRSVSKSFGK